MKIKFDSHSTMYKEPFGCVEQGEECRISMEISRRDAPLEVRLMLARDGEETTVHPMSWCGMDCGVERYTISLAFSQTGLYFYWFEIDGAQESGVFDNGGAKWQITCYPTGLGGGKQWQGAVFYQIFPDRFYGEGICDCTDKLTPYRVCDDVTKTPDFKPHDGVWNNEFYGGNLKGICKKIPYLFDLGVTAIYLNPIFMAFSNHRYDTADYMRIDPMLGNEEDFVALCSRAHQNGMKIILDGVFSHTGSDSVYFDREGRFGNGAYTCEHSPYRDWYQFGAWPHEYTAWWGIPTLPCVNELNEGFLEYIIQGENSVISHWMALGADGYRLDVADELPDEFIRRLHERVRACKPDGLVIGEVWEDASNKISYGVRRSYFSEPELDAVMNYPWRGAILDFVMGRLDAHAFSQTVMTIAEHYPAPVLACLLNSLSTHDTPRALTLLSGVDANAMSREERAEFRLSSKQYEMARERLFVASFLQFVLPGAPCIYYGDEAGAQGFEDPFNRGYFPWENPDETIIAHHRTLAAVKQEYADLRTGDIRIACAENGLVCFWRGGILAAVNCADSFARLEIPDMLCVLSGNCELEGTECSLKQNGYALFVP